MNTSLEKDCYGIPEIYYSIAETTTCRNYNVGDIVFVPKFKYENGNDGTNHLFVIIERNNYAVSLDYFCMLISSNIKKLRYSKNVNITKNNLNDLQKDSIVKTDYIYIIEQDMISFRIGNVPKENIKFYKEYCNEYDKTSKKIKKYIAEEKSLLDQEYSLIEQLSEIRKEKKLSQRQLADIIGMKQPMLANIEKKKNSPQLNTLLNILDSLGYTIEYKEKDK